MKRVLICTGLLFAATTLLAQEKAPPKSPPATASATIGGKTITITYSSPRVNGREGKIFTKDGLISHDPHYPVWRAGANAATTLKTDGDLTIGDLSVPAGTYTLFVDISDPANWVLIVSKATGEWGLAYDRDPGPGQDGDDDGQAAGDGGGPDVHDHRQWRQQRHADAGVGKRERVGVDPGALRAGWPEPRGMRRGRRTFLNVRCPPDRIEAVKLSLPRG